MKIPLGIRDDWTTTNIFGLASWNDIIRTLLNRVYLKHYNMKIKQKKGRNLARNRRGY